ncbi:putative transposable element encoded protein, partial [Trachipleistophora hominis]
VSDASYDLCVKVTDAVAAYPFVVVRVCARQRTNFPHKQ